MRSGIGKQMKEKFKLSYDLACNWWRRSDLEAIPVNIERIAEILRHAEIEVYEVSLADWLTCEPRPLGVREALTGQLWVPVQGTHKDYPPEEPGRILKILADKGVPVTL
jgi:hypothetical protein